MRRLFIAVAAALALTALGPATAANQTVTITRTGFTPADVTVNVGETVTWRNTDTNTHQVRFDRVPCNLTISAGQSASCTFRAGGRWNYEVKYLLKNSGGHDFRVQEVIRLVELG